MQGEPGVGMQGEKGEMGESVQGADGAKVCNMDVGLCLIKNIL